MTDSGASGGPQRATVDVRRVLLYALASALSCLALAAILAILTGHFDSTESKLAELAATIVIYTALATAPSRLLDGPAEPLGLAGLISCVTAAAVALLAIFVSDATVIERLALILFVTSVSLAHASVVAGRPMVATSGLLTLAQRFAYTMILLTAVAIIAEAATLPSGRDPSGVFWRLLAASVVLDGLANALVPIAARIAAPAVPDPVIATDPQMAAVLAAVKRPRSNGCLIAVIAVFGLGAVAVFGTNITFHSTFHSDSVPTPVFDSAVGHYCDLSVAMVRPEVGGIMGNDGAPAPARAGRIERVYADGDGRLAVIYDPTGHVIGFHHAGVTLPAGCH